MNLNPTQEEFMRKFFQRQRDIGQQSLENVTLLAKANIESILWAGLTSPPTIEKMEEVLEELKKEKAEQEAKAAALKKELEDGENQP